MEDIRTIMKINEEDIQETRIIEGRKVYKTRKKGLTLFFKEEEVEIVPGATKKRINDKINDN